MGPQHCQDDGLGTSSCRCLFQGLGWGRGTDPRLWLSWGSGSTSPSSTLATFFSLLLFFWGEGGHSQHPQSPRGGQAVCQAMRVWEVGLPVLSRALGDPELGHCPV